MAYNYIYTLTIVTYERIAQDNKLGEVLDVVEINDPISLSFDVQRSPYAGNNKATFDIYNLLPEKRKKIFYDYFYQDKIKAVYLEAGYEGRGKNLIYSGHIQFATSKRQGTEIVTHIEAITGLFVADSSISLSMKEGTTNKQLFDQIIKDIPEANGTQTFKEYKFIRPPALMGNKLRLMKQYTNGRVFEDLDKIYVLNDEEIPNGNVLLITDETGLLGTPERQSTTVSVNMMFEPRLQIGHGVEIRSSVEPAFNGQYKVYAVYHSGMFSYGTKSSVTTKVELFIGTPRTGQMFGVFKYDK